MNIESPFSSCPGGMRAFWFLGRRNLLPIDKVPMLERARAILAKQAKERMEAGRPKSDEEPKEIFPEDIKGQTRDQIGKRIGVSGKGTDGGGQAG